MTIGLTVKPIVALLKDRMVGTGALASVDECDDIKTAVAQLMGNKPCGFVMFTTEQAGPSQPMTGVTKQMVRYSFLVALGVQGAAGTAGKTKGTDMEALRDQVKDKLVGVQMEGMASPIVFARSVNAFKDLETATNFLGVEFSTTYQLRKEETHA